MENTGKEGKHISLHLKEPLHIFLQEKAGEENLSRAQFVYKVLREHFGIEHPEMKKKQYYNPCTKSSNKGKNVSLFLDDHIYFSIKRKARLENLTISQFICKIIEDYIPPPKPLKKNKLIRLYLGESLHVLLQEKALKENYSKSQFIHKIVQEHLGIEYLDINDIRYNKPLPESISRGKQAGLHLNEHIYTLLEETAKKEDLTASQFVCKIVEKYFGIQYSTVKQYNKSSYVNSVKTKLWIWAYLSEPLYVLFKKAAEKENMSLSQFATEAIIKYLSMSHSDAEKNSYAPSGSGKRPANKFKNVGMYLDKQLHLQIEEKVKEENTTRVKFIRKAIMQYLSIQHPDMTGNLYNNIRDYERRPAK